MNKYSLKKHIGAKPGVKIYFPVVAESLAFRRAYLSLMRKLLKRVGKTVREQIIPSYRSELLTDARESDFDALRRMIKGLMLTTNESIKKLLQLESVKHTEKFSKAARAAFKIDLAGVVAAEDLEKYIDRAALRNAGLVTGMTDDLVKKIQMTTTNSLIKGETVGALRKKLKKEFGISDRRAQIIARDQTAKLNADLNKIRHVQAGVDSYVWRTARDERVRTLHSKIDGKIYKYNEPTGAESGAEPGQPILCRCIAQGVVTFGKDEKEEPSKSDVKLPTGVSESVKERVNGEKYVLSKGSKDGNEHLVVLNSNGELIGRSTSGKKNFVKPDERLSQKMIGLKDLIAIHNHPSGRSLSNGDLRMLTSRGNGFSEVVAVGDNGSRFVAKAVKDKIITKRMYEQTSKAISNLIKQNFAVELVQGSLTSAEVDRVFAHMVNLYFKKKGMMQYDGKLSESDELIFKRLSEKVSPWN